ncbi:MAG: electron transfer flavoprotein subunit alpha/FixB family protein [candidate division KSB1 bacterium]|nr:electron transfer flavoprotein subunit alpha/FixB family protein [candidate division KSB1 bacterium]MDZ7274065.1 electron transfer flavoprotein subunit alpha/FixB family protein [candidate division KSB1 bacterium]MDZ7287889.1 electron transfer flavoprotein subunit alpha/FixB family protein [candidate division KSB1 bacterium]MDZ7296665.1 electron transfer flavoprotein subunit alpha/FixB family protein [candidate division KSB1 bacterium]MDZ7307282.1 electron transfer flavoprotein subunit alpha
MSQDIFVVAEHLKGKLADVTFEMLGKGRELADARGGNLVAVLLGNGVKNLVTEMGIANRVISVEHASLENFNPETYSTALAEVIRAKSPAATLVANSSMGMDLAAALSIRAGLPLVAYAIDVKVEDGALVATSQLYGGKLNVESQFSAEGAVVSMLAGASSADKGRATGSPAVEDFAPPLSLASPKVRFKKMIEPEGGDVDITTKEVLVSVGRGIQSVDNIPQMQELADALGGALSCSRPIVDSKWLPKTRQVGKSGVKVKPKFYLALGISGAPEHIEGMKDAELIVAINSDPNAPIFDYAHYGIVGDLFDIVPLLTEKAKA